MPSSSKSSHELWHAKCNGVLPSSSWAEHAAGCAIARSSMTSAEARVPAATWRGVRCMQSIREEDSGTSSSSSLIISIGGSNRTHACRLQHKTRNHKFFSVFVLSWPISWCQIFDLFHKYRLPHAAVTNPTYLASSSLVKR